MSFPKKGPELSKAIIAASSSGNNELVAATTGQKIYVYSFWMSAASSVTAIFKSASTALSGTFTLSAPISGEIGDGAEPLYVTAAGEALNLTLGSAVAVTGDVWYVKR